MDFWAEIYEGAVEIYHDFWTKAMQKSAITSQKVLF
jgi:hypothetical protein